MTITHSMAECDYCRKVIFHTEDIACKKCYREIEREAAGLREENQKLKLTLETMWEGKNEYKESV